MLPLPPRPHSRCLPLAAIACCALLVTHASYAGSFQLNEQSPSGLGSAYAGSAASAQDVSTLFFNPAGLAFLPQFEIQGVVNYLHPSAQFSNSGSKYLGGPPIAGSNGGDGGKDRFLPNFYASAPIFDNERWGQLALGVGVTVPWGLVTSYDNSFVGRYTSLYSELRTVDVGMSAAYRWQRFSFGAGLDVQYARATLSQAEDFGALAFGAGIPGFFPGSADGNLRLTGNDVSLGFNLGAIVQYLNKGQLPWLDDGRFGVSYRSGITQNLQGTATFTNVPGFLAPGFPHQDITATLKLPEVYHFSFSQGLLDRWTLLGDAAWTRWSRLQGLPIRFATTPMLNTTIPLNYHDALRLAGGLTYQATKDLLLRVGAAYDESPIPNETVLSPRIPDGNRVFLSGGFKYTLFHSLDLDFGYAHLFIDRPQENLTDPFGHVLAGSFHSSVDIASASLTYRFGRPRVQTQDIGKEGKDRSSPDISH